MHNNVHVLGTKRRMLLLCTMSKMDQNWTVPVVLSLNMQHAVLQMNMTMFQVCKFLSCHSLCILYELPFNVQFLE